MSAVNNEVRSLDDDTLAARVREGDNVAFDELYRRHAPTARRTARWMTRSWHAADDVTSEVFASVLRALRNGRGPQDNFAAYLRAAVRNQCLAYRKAAARAPLADDQLAEVASITNDSASNASLVATAFATLAPRWQRALWLSEVESQPATAISAELGLPASAVPALTFRARQAFAEAYLAQHIIRSNDEACRHVADKLSRHVRGTASRRDATKVELHLEQCATCRQTVQEMADLNTSLRTLPAPPVVAVATAGVGAATAWLATAAAIGALVVLPTALRSDQSSSGAAERSRSAEATIAIGAGVSPVPTEAGVELTADAAPTSNSPTDPTAPLGAPGAGDTPAAETPPAVDPGSTAGTTGTGTVAGEPQAAGPEGPSASDQPVISLDATVPTGTLPPATIDLDIGDTTPGALLPPVTVAVSVPIVDATVALGGEAGLEADVEVTVPLDLAGLGAVGADVGVDTGGVAATVVVPTLPIVGTVPPVVVDVTLPQPVTSLVDGVLGSLFGGMG